MQEKFSQLGTLEERESISSRGEVASRDANGVLDRFRLLRNEHARDLALSPAKGKKEKLSALKQKVTQLADRLADARAAIAEKDQLIARLNRQLEHSVDECTQLDDRVGELEEEIRVLETKVALSLNQYLDATRAQSDLEAHAKGLEQKLVLLQEARVQAQHSRDVQMPCLFLEVVKLSEPENKKVQQAISETKIFLNGDSSQFEKAVKAYETLNLIVHEHISEVRAFSLMAKNWMTKDIDCAHAKMNVIKKYPKALEQIKDWRKECWPNVQCHVGSLYTLREQMASNAELVSQAALSAFIALRRGSNTHVIYTCMRTAYQAFTVMNELNTTACYAEIDLSADLSRTIQAVEEVLNANGKTNASLNLDWSSSDGSDESSSMAPTGHGLPQDYVTPEDTRWWDNSPNISGEYGYDDYSADFEDVIINPANGFPMTGGGYAGVDVMGNPYGFDGY